MGSRKLLLILILPFP